MAFEFKIDETFRAFQEDTISGKYTSPLQIPIDIWQNPSWELLRKKELEQILLPFLRFSLQRSIKTIPVYKDAYKNISQINSFQDFQSIPIFVKDSTSDNTGIVLIERCKLKRRKGRRICSNSFFLNSSHEGFCHISIGICKGEVYFPLIVSSWNALKVSSILNSKAI